MQVIKLPNIDASQLSVTTTAATLKDLIETAAGESFNIPANADAIDIYVEAGNLRAALDGNVPTTTKGIRLVTSAKYPFRGLDISKIQLVSESGTADVSIQIGTKTLTN